MNIFRKIARTIEKYIPFIKWDRQAIIVTFQDIQPEILKIEQKQKIERERFVEKLIENPQKRIETLAPTQRKLITQKSKILNIIDSEQELEIFNNLNSQIELLESNLILQGQIKFDIKPIDADRLSVISEELKVIEYTKNLIPEFENNQKSKKIEREDEIQRNQNLKNEILEFSLTKIHKRREEKRIEEERLERERKLEEQFEGLINNSAKALSNLEFERAFEYLIEAVSVRPERQQEIQSLQDNVAKLENDYKNRKADFDNVFRVAEIHFHNNELEKAIENYKEAELLNIDRQICKRRISDTQNKIQRIKQREEEQRLKEQAEKEKREKYKDDADEIIAYYKENGIFNFYHYTDTRNINSIIQNNGLFSLREMDRKGIMYEQGSETREKPDYIRLSYSQNHPLLWVSKKEGRIREEKILVINLEVAGLKYTQFTNVNVARTATPPRVQFGKDLDFIRNNVKLNVVKSDYSPSREDPNHPYYQAEVMVKQHLPLEDIINLEN